MFAEFVTGCLQAEARPTLAPVPGVDLDDYIATVMRRFANPEIRDTLARLCTASSDRILKFVLPVLRASLAAGRDVRGGAAIIASWAGYPKAETTPGSQSTSPTRSATNSWHGRRGKAASR